jgi:hypothetical protein
MNLIQIQDRLKSLPNDPRVMQMLTGYANGQNPQVPPYLALGELNRRKGEMERAKMEQAGQPPGGTVKDQIQQQTGVMALQQGRQQQAMQQMAQQAAAGGGAPVPQGIPQPAPQGMAAGGLASLAPKGYRSGGVIAFNEAGSVDDAVEEDDDEDDKKSTGEYSGDAKAMLAQLMQEAAARRNMKAPTADTPLENRKKMIEADPERYGILNAPVGGDALKRLEELQTARRAELATQKEELTKSKPGILQLLGQAAMGSRGQKGGSALASILGGYSELSSGAEAKQLQQEQALRARELELQQAKSEAMNKVDDLRRAQAEGDISGEQKAKIELAKIAKDHNVSLNNLLGKQVTAAGSLAGRESAAQIAAKGKVDAAKFRENKPEKLTDLGNVIDIELKALVANGADPADPNTKRIAAQNAMRGLSKTAGTARADTDKIREANEEFRNRTLLDRNLNKLRRTDPAAYEAQVKAIREEVKTELGIEPTAQPKLSAAPATGGAPTKPAPAVSTTPPVSKLKEGVATTFGNGQTWTLKNGKPVQVK